MSPTRTTPAPRAARRVAFYALLLGGLAGLHRSLHSEEKMNPAPAPGLSPAPDLGGPNRCLTYLSTDKPVYRGGEKVYGRAVVLRAADHAPPAAGHGPAGPGTAWPMFQVIGPKGDIVAAGYGQAQESAAGFAWEVPDEQAGGEYTLKVTYPNEGHAPAERKFDVRQYRAPRLKSQIVFLRDGYGPGDAAAATLHVERAEGGVPEGAKVTAVARVDGAEAYRGETKIDAKGNCSVGFRLPAEIARGEGSLAWVVEDRGVVETASKTIPIFLQTVDIELFPEGGDLVAGLPARVYVEGRTPARKPADLAGVVVDAAGDEVAAFRTEHEGRGRFAFTPQKGGRYALKIREPAGIKTTYPLPVVKDSGATIAASRDVTGREEAVRLTVASTSAGRLKITLSKREAEVAAAVADVAAGGTAEVALTPPASAGGVSADGVLIATVRDAAGAPLAERLVFRKPAKTLHVRITPDQSRYVPGDGVKLTVATTDDAGKPAAGVVGLTVTDDSVLEMIEKREQAPRLPVMVLLETDVRELADAHVYLDEADPESSLAVDLLLGTQGWRRFALASADKFVATYGDPGRRALARRVAVVLPPSSAAPAGGAVLEARFADGRKRGGMQPQSAAKAAGAPAKPGEAENRKPRAALAPAPEPVAKPMASKAAQADARRRADAPLAAGSMARPMALADRLDEQGQSEAPPPVVVVREYAHAARPGRRAGERSDFAETLFWNAGVRTDEKTGRATVSFALSDAVTSFRVFADAFGNDGALGSAAEKIESVQPFYVEPKLPLEVTSGDTLRLPLAVVNATAGAIPGVSLEARAAHGLKLSKIEPFALPAGGRERRLMEVATAGYVGQADFVLDSRGGEFADRVTRLLRVKPAGFPVEVARGGMLGPDAGVSFDVTLPESAIPGGVRTHTSVFPTPLANLTEALQRLLQEPCGCFEQTSSTTYPTIMAQQYFLSHTGIEPATVQRSRELLDKGYNRLIGFECKKKGYEWFGEDPGHETLTAYGLLEFTDMSRVREVDPKMLAETRAFLLQSRDGKGGFKRERRALHSWIEDRDCSDGYITWALLECGGAGLTGEVQHLKESAARSTNSYVLALAANVMALAGEKDAAQALMDKLAQKQTAEGSIGGATASIVGSGGEALHVETTALAVLAWLRDPAYAASVEKSMRYLAEACKGGRFGSTQSTVLALRAIVAYDKARATPKASGSVAVKVDGHPVGPALAFDPATQGAMTLPDFAEMLSPGRHTIELRMEQGSAMPFSLAVTYNDLKPATSGQCRITVTTSLKDAELAEGTLTEADVTVTNTADETLPTPVAIVGLPGGLEVRHDQLKELVKSGRIAAYEVLGRDVVLYWRELEAGRRVELPLSLVAAVPGEYTGPASRAYLYYTDEFKAWAPGLAVKILPRDWQ